MVGLGSSPRDPLDPLAGLPDPGRAVSIDTLVEQLRLLKIWAGAPSYEDIKDRINLVWRAAGWPEAELARKSTVADCFRSNRRRLNPDLVLAVVHALHHDVGYVAQWRQALQVVCGKVEATAQVRVYPALPQDRPGFVGRVAELDRLSEELRRSSKAGAAVAIFSIEGMAGVGKTRLAVHAAHLLTRQHPFDRILFVNLRGCHPDPAQPPADPAAVLDGFLRLMDVAGPCIPHSLRERRDAYRTRLAGTRTLVVMDDAAGEDQVRPLLPDAPGCVAVITSRQTLIGLRGAARIPVDVFTSDEALTFLGQAVPEVPLGEDGSAATRIAERCGYLPLALALVAGHIRRTPGWTLTEHADRLDERRRDRRLDSDVELALDVSYRHIPAERQRMLRLLALHPGQDFDAYAAAALAGSDHPTAQTNMRQLCGDHLVLPVNGDRYTCHDLVRAYAAVRAGDEEPPRVRRAALTRLFDYYIATAATAMNAIYPAEAHRRPRVATTSAAAPDLTDPHTALDWLDTERSTLVGVAAYAAAHGWPAHATQLAETIFRYLDGGHHLDALAVHGHACQAAQQLSNSTVYAHALTNLGTAHLQLGQYPEATARLAQALALFQQNGNWPGQARVLGNLGLIQQRQGRYQSAGQYLHKVHVLFRRIGDRVGEAHTLTNLGVIAERLGRPQSAAEHHRQALALFHRIGDRIGQAHALINLGDVETRLGDHMSALQHLHQALNLCRRLGNDDDEARVLNGFGFLYLHCGRPDHATTFHNQALEIVRAIGDRGEEVWTLNGLGEAALSAGDAAAALAHHTVAHEIATGVGLFDQHARAHNGLGGAHRLLGDTDRARQHYERAVTQYTRLGMREAEEIRTHLSAVVRA
jgi:tetratricopeptide (TPR) repeat protein